MATQKGMGSLLQPTWLSATGLLAFLILIILQGPVTGRAFADESTCLLTKAATIRAQATPAAEALASAPAGLSLLVLEPENGWARVVTPGTAYGAFIPAAACKLTAVEPAKSARLAVASAPATSAGPTSSRPALAVTARESTVSATLPSTQEARVAETPQPKKKGGFWKKLGKGLLVGAAAAAVGYAAAADADSISANRPYAQMGAFRGQTASGTGETNDQPAGGGSERDCGFQPFPDSGCRIGRCVDGHWEQVCDQYPIRDCGFQPFPDSGCRIGRCVDGHWEQVCDQYPIRDCGFQPFPDPGCRIGRCVDGHWEQVCG